MTLLAAAPIVLATLIALPAQAGVAPGDTLPNGRPCPVVVSFGSYAMGIDQAAYKTVKAYAARHPRVRVVKETPWGREGERTLCLSTAKARDANRVFDDLRAAIGARARTGPTTITTSRGRAWTSDPHRRRY